MFTRSSLKGILAPTLALLLPGAALVCTYTGDAAWAVEEGRSRRFAGFYEVGATTRIGPDGPADPDPAAGEALSVVLHLRIFNFSDEDLSDAVLQVRDVSTRVDIPGRGSAQLRVELTADESELDAWVHGTAPPVSISPGGAATPQSVSLIPLRFTVDGATTGSRRRTQPPMTLTGSGSPAAVSTVAGGGPSHVPATSARLGLPYHLTLDAGGVLQIADIQRNRIFAVDPAGQLTVTAGTGKGTNLDLNGDGGMAVDAIFGTLSGLAAGPGGDTYSFEWGYHFGPDETQGHLRRIDAATGRISSVISGYPFSCPSFNPYMAGGVFDSAGGLHFIDQGCGFVWRLDPVTGQPEIVAGDGEFGFSGDGGPATSASLRSPSSLAFDGDGNLYVGDAGNNRIRRVDAATRIITTIAGNGIAGDGGDGGPAIDASLDVSSLTLDAAGNIYFTDTVANRVRRIDHATGIITPAAGSGQFGFSGDSGPATEASLAFPFGIVSDASGNLFIADVDNNRVRRVDALTGRISTYAGGGVTLWGDGGPALDAELGAPSRVAVSDTDEILIVTRAEGRIRRVDPVTDVIDTVALIAAATDLTHDRAGDLLIAEDSYDGRPARVRRLDAVTGEMTTVAGGGTLGDGVDARQTHLDRPAAIETDAAGNLYIAVQPDGSVSGTVRRVDASTGIIETVAGGGSEDPGDGLPATEVRLGSPSGIALDAAGNLFISEEAGRRVRRVDAVTGRITTVTGRSGPAPEGNTGDGGPAAEAGLADPTDLVIDARGDIYVSTRTYQWNGQYSGRVRRIDAATGIIETVAEAIGPVGGLAADRRGNIFFVDGENDKVRRLSMASRRPVASASAGAVAECGAPLMLDGSGSTDPDSTAGTHDDIVTYEWYEGFRTAAERMLGAGETLSVTMPVGVHQITLVVYDTHGEKSADAITVHVRDTLAPQLTVDLSRTVLSPPNHRMVPVRATVSVVDQCGPATFQLTSVTSNEPGDARGRADGKTARDIANVLPGTTDTRFLLRAERSTRGSGRIYTVVYEATDDAGNTTTATGYVTVPLGN